MVFLLLLSILVSIAYIAGVVFLIEPYRKHADRKKLPFVSILIATRNEEKVIEKTLIALKDIDYPRYEVVVVDGSSDKTAKIAKRYADKVVVEKTPQGKAHALNLALTKARGEIIYVLDADSRPEKDTLKHLVRALDRNYYAVVGTNIPENKNNFLVMIGRIETAYLNSVEKIINRFLNTAIVPGRNYIIYKKELKKIGGFRNVITEDLNLSWRLYKKGKMARIVAAKCYEQVPDRLSWYFKQQRRWIAGSFYEIGNVSKHLTPSELFIVLPSMLFISGVPCITLLSLIIYAATGLSHVFYVFFLGMIIMLISVVMYLEKKDVIYFPVTFILLGVLQWANVIDAFFKIIRNEKVKWYKTPKEDL